MTQNNRGSKNSGGMPVSMKNAESFKVTYKLNLVTDEAAYTLIIDSQKPISSVIMQSKQNIDILNIKDNLAKINRIQEISDPNISSLAHLQVQSDENNLSESNKINRLEIKIRTSEG
jgi:Co/Zn/Cd efflux system component